MWSFKFKGFEVIDKKNISSKFLANKKISRRCPNSRRCFNSNKRSDSRFIENWGSKWWSLWERNKEKRLGFRELVGRLLLPRRRFNFTPSLIPSSVSTLKNRAFEDLCKYFPAIAETSLDTAARREEDKHSLREEKKKKRRTRNSHCSKRGNRAVNFSTGILRFFSLSVPFLLFYPRRFQFFITQRDKKPASSRKSIAISYFFYAFLFSIRAIFAFPSWYFSIPKRFVSIQRCREIQRFREFLEYCVILLPWNFANSHRL